MDEYLTWDIFLKDLEIDVKVIAYRNYFICPYCGKTIWWKYLRPHIFENHLDELPDGQRKKEEWMVKWGFK